MKERNYDSVHVEQGAEIKMWTRGVPVEHEAKEHLTAGLAALARLAPPTFKDLLALEGEG